MNRVRFHGSSDETVFACLMLCVLRVSPDSWNLGEAIFQSCDEGESVSGLTYEVEEFDFSSDYTYDGSGIYGDYVITSISLECSVVGELDDVDKIVFTGMYLLVPFSFVSAGVRSCHHR